MGKIEIQEWRDRLVKMFGVYHSDGQEYVTCPLCGINLDELANHMIKELDKAREEGRREVIHKLKEEIDMAEASKFIDAHQDFFNSFGKSMLLKISKLNKKK